MGVSTAYYYYENDYRIYGGEGRNYPLCKGSATGYYSYDTKICPTVLGFCNVDVHLPCCPVAGCSACYNWPSGLCSATSTTTITSTSILTVTVRFTNILLSLYQTTSVILTTTIASTVKKCTRILAAWMNCLTYVLLCAQQSITPIPTTFGATSTLTKATLATVSTSNSQVRYPIIYFMTD